MSAAKAAGRLAYTLDAGPADALYARLIRARGPHSLAAVDRESVRRVPGVIAVLTAADDPSAPFSTNPVAVRQDCRVFTTEARYAGDVVGAVVASTRAAARAAARVPALERALPAVVTVEAARASDAPPAHRSFESNLIARIELGCDDATASAALGRSDHVFEATYACDAAAHNFLEPAAAVATWDGSSSCHIRSNAQCPHLNVRLLAQILGLQPAQVDYESAPIGGSFGGKEEFLLDAAAALCSRAVGGRPVVLETDRREMTAASRTRHECSVRVRTGCSDDAVVTARVIEATFACGAYAGHSPNVLANGLSLGLTLYPHAAARAVGDCVSTNRVPPGPYRGYGGPEVLFAVESQLDEIATALAISPVELRSRNALRRGQRDPAWGWPVSFDLEACMRRGEAAMGSAHAGRVRRGRGVAALCNISGLTGPLGVDSAEVTCAVAGGRVHVRTASTDLGQGLYAVLARVVADELGVPRSTVAVGCEAELADVGPVASRGSYITAGAACLAARALREMAGDRPVLELDGLTVTRSFSAADNGLVAGAQFAEVEVDVLTGRVRPLRVVSVHDVGRLLHPSRARGQVRGGVIHGIGMALTERVCFNEDGSVADATLQGQGLPPADWPIEVEAEFVENGHDPSPLGAKGLGESPVMAVLPAIANAIHDATGARVREAPFTPERVLRAIGDASVPA